MSFINATVCVEIANLYRLSDASDWLRYLLVSLQKITVAY